MKPRVFSWSPDSSGIAFVSQSGEIGRVSLSGRETTFTLPKGLAASGYPNSPPQWSQNGKMLMFAAASSSDRNDIHVYIIGVNGHNLRVLGGTR